MIILKRKKKIKEIDMAKNTFIDLKKLISSGYRIIEYKKSNQVSIYDLI